MNRKESTISGTRGQSFIAYLSSAIPLIYISDEYGNLPEIRLAFHLLTILGFLIVIWATIDLGNRLGVSAAKRGDRCTTGIYRYFKHPMYIGYVIAQIGWVLVNKWNILIYIISLALMFYRSKAEEKILSTPS
jgi:protein-S-isoprenylcysteine O-methyltransferase Ste14